MVDIVTPRDTLKRFVMKFINDYFLCYGRNVIEAFEAAVACTE